jgi:hypothetical protein
VSARRRVAGVGALLAATAGLATACDGASANKGFEEPLQVTSGQFVTGPIPGTAPAALDAGGAPGSANDAGHAAAPAITQVSGPVLALPVGATAQAFSGFATDDAVAVGVAFADMGTGYWVVPVGATDPMYPRQIGFGMRANFNADDPPGRHTLVFAAIDGNGRSGPQLTASVCLSSPIPDNGHACNPAKAPPAAVISLEWDTNFDIDLHVQGPDGSEWSPKTPTGVVPDGGATAAGVPTIDRDSLGGCIPDGMRQEDLIFPNAPPPGFYRVYVDPFAPCGQASVRFNVRAYARAGVCPACGLQPIPFTPVADPSGELLASQVTGGGSTGLFIGQVQLGH